MWEAATRGNADGRSSVLFLGAEGERRVKDEVAAELRFSCSEGSSECGSWEASSSLRGWAERISVDDWLQGGRR